MSLKEYALYEDEDWYHKNYRAELIGCFLEIDKLEECIKAKSNAPFYPAAGGSLNNPANKNVMSEYVSVDRAIGRCYNRSTNKYEETRRICIRYTNKGVHLYPTKEVDGHE